MMNLQHSPRKASDIQHAGRCRLPAGHSRGFSLVEILVAVVVLSVGLLGLAALQTSSLRAGNDSYLRTQANLLAYNIIDRMRANYPAVSAKDYDLATGATVTASTNCASATCTTQQLADWDRKQWLDAVTTELPQASASITTQAAGDHTQIQVTVTWLEQRVQKSAAAAPTTITVTTLI